MIYEQFLNLLARGKVDPEKGLKAVLVKGYAPAPKHTIADVKPAAKGELDASGKWKGKSFVPDRLDARHLEIETKDVDGVVWCVNGIPACHCPLEDQPREKDAKYLVRTIDFPEGIMEVMS